MFGLHLTVDGVAVLFPRFYVSRNAFAIHCCGNGFANLLHEFFAVTACSNNGLVNQVGAQRVKCLEAQILQLCFQRMNAQSIRDRGIKI